MKESLRTGTSTYSHYTDKLLALPREDLKRQPRGDLVLCQLPYEELCRAPCRLVANDNAASLVTPTKSFTLTTVGTSNTLVVWNATSTSDEASLAPARKKQKLQKENQTPANNHQNASAQFCRLVQPGGSGASYWYTDEKNISKQQIWNLLTNQSNDKTGKESTRQKKKQQWSTDALALELQAATPQIQQRLEELACVECQNNKDTTANDKYWHPLSESDRAQARMAVVGVVCEVEQPDVDSQQDDSWRVSYIPERLFLEELSKSAYPQVAEKAFQWACRHQDDDPSSKTIDPKVIVHWIIHDLFRQQRTWNTTTFWETLQSRLPLEDAYQNLLVPTHNRAEMEGIGGDTEDSRIAEHRSQLLASLAPGKKDAFTLMTSAPPVEVEINESEDTLSWKLP